MNAVNSLPNDKNGMEHEKVRNGDMNGNRVDMNITSIKMMEEFMQQQNYEIESTRERITRKDRLEAKNR